jgi:serine/threonine-protein kinase
MARAVPESLIGRTVGGKFVIEATLGVGAMGAVYKARHPALDKAVAVKIMHRDLADDPQFLARFQREAKAASRLDHPCSIRVIDYGQEQDGLVYLAMEFIDGRDLLKVITEDWPLSPMRVVEILSQVLSALGKAHELGIIHRDLKPENIMVIREHDDEGKPRDAVKVCDFGIAKVSDARAFQTSTSPGLQPLTTMGTLVGTPEYMSPEQGRGEPLDPRSDLYSVGVVLFQMLTGTLPFTAENALGVVLKHVTDEPPAPSSINAMVMPALEAICLKALRKKRDERFQTARDMRSQLRAAVGLELPSHPKSSLADTLPVGGTSRVANLPLHVANTEVNLQPASAGMPVAAQSEPRAHPMPPFERKETHTSTAVDIPLERSRTLSVLLSLFALFALGGFGAWIASRMQSHPKVAAAAGSASASGGVVDISPIEQSTLPPLATPDTSQPARPLVAPRLTGRPTAATSTPIASAAAVTTATSTPTSTATSTPTSTPTSTSTPTATATASPTPTASTTADPSFDPEHARVQIGMMNLSGVKEPALRGLLRSVGLTGCYRRALKAKGARVSATPTLNLSIDHDGKIAAAMVTGLNELPDAVRCFQRELNGQQLPAGTFDTQGSNAEVWLTLSPE